jgi:ribosomal protein L11
MKSIKFYKNGMVVICVNIYETKKFKAVIKNKVLKIINNELYDYEKAINENNVKIINDLKRRQCIEINKTCECKDIFD